LVNAVDRIDERGRYLRAFDDASGAWSVTVDQPDAGAVRVRTRGVTPADAAERIAGMLGTGVAVEPWESRTRRFPWLHRLARNLRGLRPPRYPSLWEALCNAVVFQQISLVAASAIMERLVLRFSSAVRAGDATLYPFPAAASIAGAGEEELRGLGLSRQKTSYVRAIAREQGAFDVAALRAAPLDVAVAALRALPGVGVWSANVALLRGCGRLDAFPPGDSGVRAAVRALSGNPDVDLAALLDGLGDRRGLLYFHLLLGRLQAARVTTSS
jgi:DNA-3-methyladenine glycosylase II